MCLCVLCVVFRVELCASLCLCELNVIVWFVCAFMCDGVWCVGVRLCVLLYVVCAICFVAFEYVCVFCLGCIV